MRSMQLESFSSGFSCVVGYTAWLREGGRRSRIMLQFRPAGHNRIIKPLYLQSQPEGVRLASTSSLFLRIRLVSADLRIPIRRRIGEELTLPAEGAHRFFIDFDAQAWPRRNGDVTLNHEVPCVGYVFVPGWLRLVPFHGEEVLAGGYRVHGTCVADRGSVAVDHHPHRIFGRHVGGLLQFETAADNKVIRVDIIDCCLLYTS